MNITLSNIVNIETATDSAQETIIVLTGADGNECVVTAFKAPQVAQEETQEETQEEEDTIEKAFDYLLEMTQEEQKKGKKRQDIFDMVKRFNVPRQYRSKVECRLVMNVEAGVDVSTTAEELGQALFWEDSLEGHQFWSLMSDIIDTHNAK